MKTLHSIAYARSGDKGSSANIAIFGRTAADYLWLREHLTARHVEAWFKSLGTGVVERYDVPNLEALNFVLPGVLAGGGSLSLRIDAQGKTLGQALLAMPMDFAAERPLPTD